MVLNNPTRIRRSYSDMTFQQIISTVEKFYGRSQPPPMRDPFGMIIWENIGYLVDDPRRKVAFEELERSTGLKPTAILATPLAELTRIAKCGGIHEGLRAHRLKEIAHIG